MDEQNAPTFSQAKMEYTNQLIDILTPHLFDGIQSIYNEAKTINNVSRSKTITILFRDFLEKYVNQYVLDFPMVLIQV